MVKLYIGRGHEAHVRVTDISVSRLHAFLVKSTQGYYFLTDNESKFGTLSLIKTPQMLKPNSANVLQIGRTLFDIEIKQNYQSFLQNCLCLGPKRKKDFNNDLMLTVNGLQSFPSQFATTEYIELMFNRRVSSIRKQSSIKTKHKKGRDLGELNHNDSSQLLANFNQNSPHGINIPTQNHNEEES